MTSIQRLSIAALVCIWGFLSIVGCTLPLKEQSFKTPQAQLKLLISGDASPYKDTLRSAIVENYRERANIQVTNIDRLGDISPDDFDAILIINTCLAWTHLNPTILSFMEKPAAAARVVWFMTVDDIDARYHHGGVDAITAASVVENQQGVTRRLIQEIDAIVLNPR